MRPGDCKHRNKNTCNINCQSNSRVQLCYVVQCYFCCPVLWQRWILQQCSCGFQLMQMCLNEYGQGKRSKCGCMCVMVTEGHSSGWSWGEKPCIYLSSQFLSTKILLSLGALAAVVEAGLQHCAMTTLCGCTGYMTAVWHNSSCPHWS